MYGARAAYKSVQATTNYGRDLEAAVLTRAAHDLRACQEHWNDPGRDQRLEDALRINQRIWSVFQAEISQPNHPMPVELRRDLLSLGAFVDKRVLEVLQSPDPRKLDAIININMNIAAGLLGG
jgi:flagellar biosynthesis activator protein FlaF